MYHEGHVANAEENYPMAKVISRMEAFCSKQINQSSKQPSTGVDSIKRPHEMELQTNGGSWSFPVMSPHSPRMNHF